MSPRSTIVQQRLQHLRTRVWEVRLSLLMDFYQAAAVLSPRRKKVLQQARAEGLVLRAADNLAGYYSVRCKPGRCAASPRSKPYQALVRRNGKHVHLGYFVTAEEAAVCVARSPEAQAAAKLAAAKLAVLVSYAPPPDETQQQARDRIIGTVALNIIYEAAGAATDELSAEVAAEVMAGIAMGL